MSDNIELFYKKLDTKDEKRGQKNKGSSSLIDNTLQALRFKALIAPKNLSLTKTY